MKSILLILALALVGMAGAQDYVEPVDTVLVKDLGNLSLAEIRAIFAGDGGWMNIGGSPNTPSIDAFRRENPEDGTPQGNGTKKAAFVGGKTSPADPRVM